MDPAVVMKVVTELVGPGGPFEIGVGKVNGFDCKIFTKGPQTLRDLFDASQPFASRDFVVLGDERLSFREARRQAAAVAHELGGRLGVRQGDRVGVCMRNLPEWIVAFMAAAAVGAVVVPVNSWWVTSELEYGIEDSGLRVLFVDQQRFDRVAPVYRKLGVTVVVARPTAALPAGVLRFADLVPPPPPAAATEWAAWPATARPVGADDVACIMYTSGTTNHPKGVVSTHRTILSAVSTLYLITTAGEKLKALAGMPADANQPTTLLAVPLFHTTGTHAVFLPCYGIGRKIVLMHKWHAEEALRLIQKERVTHFTGVPTMSIELINCPNLHKYDTSTLLAMAGGGAAVPPKMVQQIPEKVKTAAPMQGYGLTETNAITCINHGPDYAAHPTSCGRPTLLMEVRIVDEATNRPVPVGQPGEICIRGAMVMQGYWNKPDATAQAIDKEGWFHSGDIGKVDEEGFVYILDRAKDMIIRGGENISCPDVEYVVYDHPAVQEVAVVGLPHPTLGEEVCAVVVPRPGAVVDERDLRAFAEARLAKFKVPTKVVVWTEPTLPRGATGKIQKREIRERLKPQAKL